MIKLISPFKLKENPYQTRSDTSVAKIQDLVSSIRSNGQDEPVEVYKENGSWVILEGHRRTLACAALGIRVRCRVVEKPSDSELLQIIFRRNTVRHNHTPSAVVLGYIVHRLEESNRNLEHVTLRQLAKELCIGYEKVRHLYALFRKLPKDIRIKAIKEKWSEAEIKVYLGLPSQREHEAKRQWDGSVKPHRVILHKDNEGRLWMSCLMRSDADVELLAEYYHSRKWPDLEVRVDGYKRMRKLRDVHEKTVRGRSTDLTPSLPEEV